jgi:hypothetical protein
LEHATTLITDRQPYSGRRKEAAKPSLSPEESQGRPAYKSQDASGQPHLLQKVTLISILLAPLFAILPA